MFSEVLPCQTMKEAVELVETVEETGMIYAYRSILRGNIPTALPNLRDKESRDRWREDTACTDPGIAGEMLLPTFSKGTPEIDASVYQRMKNMWEAECGEDEGSYRSMAFQQGTK